MEDILPKAEFSIIFGFASFFCPFSFLLVGIICWLFTWLDQSTDEFVLIYVKQSNIRYLQGDHNRVTLCFSYLTKHFSFTYQPIVLPTHELIPFAYCSNQTSRRTLLSPGQSETSLGLLTHHVQQRMNMGHLKIGRKFNLVNTYAAKKLVMARTCIII